MKTKTLPAVIVFVILFFTNTQKIFAQAHIEPVDFPNYQISIPVENQIFAKYKIISDSNSTYVYVDNCKILFYDFGNFSAMSLRNIKFFADNTEIMMQSILLGDYWEFYPGLMLGFPYGYADTLEIYFTANMPDTILYDYVPNVGDSLNTSISCTCHFSSVGGTFDTNDTISKTVIVISSTAGIGKNFTEDFSLDKNQDFKIFDILGREVNKNNFENLPKGIYIWRQKEKAGKFFIR